MAERKRNSGHTRVFHHTDTTSAEKILDSGVILQSLSKSKYDDAAYGDGTYLTKIGPDASRYDVVINNYDGTRMKRHWKRKKSKTDAVFEFKVPKSRVEDHSDDKRSILRYEGDVDLEDVKNLKVHVREGDDSYYTYVFN